MLDWVSESVLVGAFLSRMAGLTDPNYKSKDPAKVSAEALKELVDREAVIVHVDAGSRVLQDLGSPVTTLKLAIYEVDFSRQPPETNIYYPVYSWQQGPGTRRSYILYAPGDYRVRQALSYIVEIAALYSRMKHYVDQGRLVIGFRDGPLIQLLGQYLRPVFSLDDNTVDYALRYAGLDEREIYRVMRASKMNNSINAGLVMLEILSRLHGLTVRNGYPAGVVEDTSRSRALMLWLLADIIVDTLKRLKPEDLEVADDTVEIASSIVNTVSRFINKKSAKINDCTCANMSLASTAMRILPDIMLDILARIKNILSSKGMAPGGYKFLQKRVMSGGEAEVYMSLVRGASLSQIFGEVSTRDPDLVMTAYYLGFLESFITRPVPRYSVVASILDAVERIKSTGVDSVGKLPAMVQKYYDIVGRLLIRYVVTDPPLTCDRLEAELKSRRISGVLKPCEVARLDTYLYAPPVRLEYFDGSDDRLIVGAAVLESTVARYKYPVGVLVSDKASRLTMEEALTARPLEKRLVPLRYYIRSWEKRLEYT